MITIIRLVPRTTRAKNRVREHGDVFKVECIGTPHCFKGKESVCLRSIEDFWQGWFCLEDDDIKTIIEIGVKQ